MNSNSSQSDSSTHIIDHNMILSFCSWLTFGGAVLSEKRSERQYHRCHPSCNFNSALASGRYLSSFPTRLGPHLTLTTASIAPLSLSFFSVFSTKTLNDG